MPRLPRRVSAPDVVNVDDMRRLAKRRLPKVVFDYLDGGAEDEITLEENCSAFREITFHPRNAVSVPEPDLKTQVLGHLLDFPAMLAPVGYSRLMHPGGEVAAAAAAGAAGIGYILSTISGHSLENVKAATPGPAWYQVYLVGGRDVAEGAIERASRAGFSALVVTIDTPVAGMRERDPRSGMKELLSGGFFAKFPFLLQFVGHPRWVAGFLLDGGVPPLPNIVIPGKGPMPLLDVTAALARAVVTWDDLKWIRESWRGPIVVKGVVTAEDARRSVGEGADAIVVSNHGGRQLDCVSPSLQTLPEIVSAVGNQTEVLFDGGIRRGSDIVKAICLGARAVLLGRGYAYGLGAAGQPGVTRALDILRADVERTLKLLGADSIGSLSGSYVECPSHWPGVPSAGIRDTVRQ